MRCPVCGHEMKLSNYGLNMECENQDTCKWKIISTNDSVTYQVGNFKATYYNDQPEQLLKQMQKDFVTERDKLATKLNEKMFYTR